MILVLSLISIFVLKPGVSADQGICGGSYLALWGEKTCTAMSKHHQPVPSAYGDATRLTPKSKNFSYLAGVGGPMQQRLDEPCSVSFLFAKLE